MASSNQSKRIPGAVSSPKAANYTDPFGTSKRQSNRGEFAEVPDLGKALDAVVEAGAAVLVGRTSDGGACVVTILDGERRYRTYPVDQEGLNNAIKALWERYSDAS